jgi:hypothetical protein
VSFQSTLQRVVDLAYQRGKRTPWAKTACTCQQILQAGDGLRTFLEIESGEASNNPAVGALRQSVIERKILVKSPWA